MIHVVVLTKDNLAEVSIASGTAPDVVSSYYRANYKEGVPLFYAYSVSQIEQNRITMSLERFAEKSRMTPDGLYWDVIDVIQDSLKNRMLEIEKENTQISDAENFKKFAKALDLELSTWQQDTIDNILGKVDRQAVFVQSVLQGTPMSFTPTTVHKEHIVTPLGGGTERRAFCDQTTGDEVAVLWDNVTCAKCLDKQRDGWALNHNHGRYGCIRSICNCQWTSSTSNASVCTCK